MDSSAFGTFFVGKSFPISDLNFQRIDATHWLLDVCATVSPNYPELKEIALYLTKPNLLPVEAALALYIKAGSSEWLYRGCVHGEWRRITFMCTMPCIAMLAFPVIPCLR